jgi:carboxylesterase type B
MATEGNVIVVTLNYRINLFGFLALDHPAAKGNSVLKIQFYLSAVNL